MNWDEYFMELACTTAKKSRDPSTQVGCVLVDEQNRVISMGYNGFPRGIYDADHRLEDRTFKYAVTLHAEENAILFAQRDLSGARAYVWPMQPCAHCAAMLIQSGIRSIHTLEPTDEHLERWRESFGIARLILDEAGVDVVYHGL